MASTFKTFLSNDKTTARMPLYEAVPMTGSLFSGSDYAEENIKLYSHGMFQSVYDYPYASSSANHLCDVTFGIRSGSAFDDPLNEEVTLKNNIYNQMAQVLMGFDASGSILPFRIPNDEDTMDEIFVVNLSRLSYKDEIKKGSVELSFGDELSYTGALDTLVEITDDGADVDYYVDSPTGEYGILSDGTESLGLVFYQAGIAVLTGSIGGDSEADAAGETFEDLYVSGSIDELVDGYRHRVANLDLVNTTEINSELYFCRVHHNDFNYSGNPTYVSSSQIVVKDSVIDPPVSYVTGVGLYDAEGELLAVAKLSEALKKDPSVELTLRVRLDY